MEEKIPKSLDLLWTEKDLCKKFDLRMGKAQSIVIGHWIAAGLKCVKISDRRFFWEDDVINFLMDRQKRQETNGDLP